MVKLKRAAVGLIAATMLAGGTASAQSSIPDSTIEREWKGLRVQPSDLDDHWAEQLFQWAIRTNIINGYPDGTFKPDKSISEAEFLKVMYRAFGIALPSSVQYNWTEGAYRLAASWNHPVLGSAEPELRLAPINRGRAAEIIAAAQGFHYEGRDAIVYVVGNGLANRITLATEKGFDADGTLSRAEAIQWIRRLILKGMVDVKPRPKALSDHSLLPELPVEEAVRMPDFSTEPITKEDLNLFEGNSKSLLKLGDSRESIGSLYGTSAGLDVFDSETYPSFSIHFNENGKLDSWKIDLDIHEGDGLQTKKGIVLGQSTLFDVLKKYGTAGYDGDGVANYYYEVMQDGTIRSLTSFYQLNKADNVYVISFLFDKQTLTVNYINVSWYPFARGDFF
ncbi:S-layer homology domain-containing protein [Paenibacillus spongiae]|uniref:S-layer homology domain-containing protein n=1 Tax=Paenibacillus spongiae TaxID=2909671 RepID=A0ABY5SH20_9BACL|nr:S-layer homology domain-containing protein [Paenibacillus spongiae]UVI33064.1 S-layer homology domain-containing protein [Paenibacillus spongiae]